MAKSISTSQDLIDSRDVIARIRELERDRDAAETPEEWETENPGDAEELKALTDLQDEADGYSDWRHGATLIRDSYFEDYARDLADDLHGRAARDASWPFDYIDWEKAADALKMDYTSVSFGGEDYWVRS